MTNEQILQAAVEKAAKNGFHDGDVNALKLMLHGRHIELRGMIWWQGLVFSHDFATAFFGTHDVDADGSDIPDDVRKRCDDLMGEKLAYNQAWEHHLQQMVLEEDPIRYLEQFLYD